MEQAMTLESYTNFLSNGYKVNRDQIKGEFVISDNKQDLITTLAASRFEPITLEIDNEDNIYLTNASKGYIDKYNKEGEYISTFMLPAAIENHLFIAVDIIDDDARVEESDDQDNGANLLQALISFFLPNKRLLNY